MGVRGISGPGHLGRPQTLWPQEGLSLRRSEGFGRGMAEALQLGLDVIAAYTAATPTSAPVRLPIPCGAYPCADGHRAELGCRALAAHKGLDSRDLFGEFSAGDLRVMSSLGTEPVARAQSQETAKA